MASNNSSGHSSGISTGSSAPKGSDEFTSNVSEFFDAIAQRWQWVVAFALLVVLACAATVFVMNKKEEKVDQGRNALFLAQKSIDEQMKKISEALVSANKTDIVDKKTGKAPMVDPEAAAFEQFDVDAKLGPQVKMLESVAADYPHTRPSYEAMMLLGKLYLDHGNPSSAATWFQKSTQTAPVALDRALAWSSVGYANENAMKYKEAIDAFDHALGEGEGTIKGDLLMGKARSFEALHDSAQAKGVYDQIISQLPGTEYAKNAEAFKARTQ
jgi:TolA-binding protein